jgi:hypothetical protein
MAPIPSVDMDLPAPGEAGERWRRAKTLLNDGSLRVTQTYDELIAGAD